MRKFFSSTFLIAVLSLAAFSNARPPETPKPKQSKAIDTQLRITISDEAKEARLVIPKSQLKQLRSELEQLDNEQNTAATAALNFNQAQTIFGGFFLSLAFVFGGFWLVRARKVDLKANRTLVVCAVLCLSVFAATLALGNAGPPPEARKITGKIFSQSVHIYKFASGKIKLETSDTATEVELIVPDAPAEKKSGEE